jgi:hypothetical protein
MMEATCYSETLVSTYKFAENLDQGNHDVSNPLRDLEGTLVTFVCRFTYCVQNAYNRYIQMYKCNNVHSSVHENRGKSELFI